jgi:asparagine synthase (glutamine-hydrolysing)
MCGIAGIFAYHIAANSIDCGELARIRDYMTRRGPDAAGEWRSSDGRIGLAHRRLSVIDLSDGGSQPMVSADRKLVVTFNGEIYNYRELRKNLEARGRVFRSQSDTEVLLLLYAEKGEAMVHDLRGMFAFAIWDAERKRLFLGRDPNGIKPLYYTDDGGTLRFASQVKALLAGGKVSRDPHPAGWVGYYLFGSVPEPYTTYLQIRALPAGTTLCVDRIGVSGPHRYHFTSALYREAELQHGMIGHEDDHQERIRLALLDSVRHHLVADVPVGAFLSGGIDSGALIGLMRDAGQSDILTVTLAFEEFRGRADDEAPFAARVAQIYGTRHTTRRVTEQEFRADISHIFEAMDQPSIDGVNTWFVSKAAHELGLKVVVSGVGGDELFGGYPSFRHIPKWVPMLALSSRVPRLGSFLRRMAVASGAMRLNVSPKSFGMLEYGGSYAGMYLLRRGLFMPWELHQVLDAETIREGLHLLRPLEHIEHAIAPSPLTAFAKVACLENALYMRNQLLRDTDWASMAHSLEVRLPLVDRVLLERLAPLLPDAAGRNGKRLLSNCPARPLPPCVTSKKKTGFMTPIGEWIARMPQTSTGITAAIASTRQHWSRRWARFVHSALQSSQPAL